MSEIEMRAQAESGFQVTLAAMVHAVCHGGAINQRAWLSTGRLAVYLRVQKALLVPGLMEPAVVIANITVRDHDQRRGHFKRMLGLARQVTDLPIVVEAIVNPEFCASLMRYGFAPTRNSTSEDPTLYWRGPLPAALQPGALRKGAA